jgi:hypothetical protein
MAKEWGAMAGSANNEAATPAKASVLNFINISSGMADISSRQRLIWWGFIWGLHGARQGKR